jgi:uncharacterized protein
MTDNNNNPTTNENQVEFIKNDSTNNADANSGSTSNTNSNFEQFNSSTADLPNPLPANSESKNISTLTHLSMILFWFPIVPIALYFAYPNDEFVKENAKEDINLYISLCILYIIGTITALILIGFIIIFATALLHIALYVFLAIKSSEGKVYRLPSILRLIK